LRFSSIFFVAIFLALLLPAGCYTLLHHPSEIALPSPDDEESGGGGCGACHLESEWFGYYDHDLIYGAPGYLAYQGYGWWTDSYARPWWQDESWYGDGYGHYGDASSSGLGRSSWRKRAMRRGESPDESSGSVIYPGSKGGGSVGSATGAPSSGAGSTAVEKKKEPEPPNKKKKTR